MNRSNQIKFPRFSFFTILFVILGLIYSLMLIGVYITSSHQGLSCLTWPLCPNGFDYPPPKYFFEHVHRSIVLILAVTLFSFTIYSVKTLSNKGIKLKLILASVILSVQIILGWFVIYTQLNPIVVASHLSTAVALFGIIFVTLLSVYNEIKKEKIKEKI
ncbi:MAG: COX15/CtaA family protein [Candidatus Nitrosocosmicus sp.]